MLELLTTRQTLVQPTQTFRYMVALVSNDLDFEGVPVGYKTIDVVVSEPTQEAIATLVTATPWLIGYSLASFWAPEDGYPEF